MVPIRVYVDWRTDTSDARVFIKLPVPVDVSQSISTAQIRLPHLGGVTLAVSIAAYYIDDFGIPNPIGRYRSLTGVSPAPADQNILDAVVLTDDYSTTAQRTDPGFSPTNITHLGVEIRKISSGAAPLPQFFFFIDSIQVRLSTPLTLFSGYISSLNVAQDFAADKSLLFTVRCRDKRVLTDTTLLNRSYTSVTDQSAIIDIITASGLNTRIAATTATVAHLGNITATFVDTSVTDALNQIAQQTGGSWRIDADEHLYYFDADSGLAVAPIELNDDAAAVNGTTVFSYRLTNYQQDFFTPCNYVVVKNKDATTGAEIAALAQDTASQAHYGFTFAQIWNPSYFGTLASTQDLANQYLASHNTPIETATVTTELETTRGLRAGMYLKVSNQLFNWVQKPMKIQRITINPRPGTDSIKYTIDLGDYRPDFISQLRKLQ